MRNAVPFPLLPTYIGMSLSSLDGSQYVGGAIRRTLSRRLSFGLDFRPLFLNALGISASDDPELIAAMAGGSEKAAARLYDKYSAPLYALALRVVGEPADAEDVLLSAFSQVWNTAGRYELGRGSVLGWMTTIVRTRALDVVRSRGRRSKAVDSASQSAGDDPVAAGAQAVSASDQVELDERATAVQSAMTVLSEPQRTAIELAFYEGLSHSEIAERLGEPLGTVKTRIRLGMQRLRDALRNAPQAMLS
jgi:RNA polymerase sigma-70 factor (ECF subfamily)